MKEKLTKNIFEQVPVNVNFHMKSKLGNPSHLETFGKNFARCFVGKLLYLQEVIHSFFKN